MMGHSQEPKHSRSTTWIKLYTEKWLLGSLRIDLEPDERGVWADFLSLSSLNFGTIEAYSRDQIAQQLFIDRELLDRSINKFVKTKRIERKYRKREKKEIFSIVKWDKYQSDFLKKRANKSSTYEKEKRDEESEESDTEFSPREDKKREEEKKREERRLDKIKQDKNRTDESLSNKSSSPSKGESPTTGDDQIEAECLSILRGCPGYPAEEYEDKNYIYWAMEEYPHVDFVAELSKFAEYVKKTPGAFEGYDNPRKAISKWMENAQ